MVFKITYKHVFIALLLVSLSLAQTGINETSYDRIADQEKPYVFTILLISISLLTIYLLYGYISKNEKEILNAKNELGQVLVTCIIIIFAYVFMIGINAMFTYEFKHSMNMSDQTKININTISSTKEFNAKEFDSLFEQSRKTIENGYGRIVDYRTAAAVPTTLPRIVWAELGFQVICAAMSGAFIILPVSFGPGEFLDGLLNCGMTVSSFTTMLDSYQNTFATVLEMELNSIFSRCSMSCHSCSS